ncbi:MAG: 3-hydroxyacyl-CoA dehydrogenase family protein [Firmicutes bacterium]|nr:3-hydroxyacyl-CoA dehydrogenase family protein [Bacillota bacterium]
MEGGTVGVIGLGQMGSQIALLCALRGLYTRVFDSVEGVPEHFQRWAASYLDDRVQKGKLDPAAAEQARTRLFIEKRIEDCVRPADYVVEAVVENLQAKQQVFQEADEASHRALLFTNSSTIPSSQLVKGLRSPGRVCNVHFFNPALVMELVEIVKGPHTTGETVTAALEFARRLGKTPVLLNREIRGFAVNRVLDSIWRESVYLVGDGVISPEDLDTAVVKGLGHPMGPFRLMDLVGIDLVYSTQEAAYRETGEARLAPSPLLATKVNKGETGKKSGKGWYSY